MKSKYFTEPKKTADYLFYMEYTDFPEMKDGNYPLPEAGGCSSVRNGNFYGRNLDLYYCDTPEVVVHAVKSKKRFESISVCSKTGTDLDGFMKLSEEEFLTIPNLCTDGINENGVAINVNVTMPVGIDDMKSTNPGKEKMFAPFVVRFILDNAETAEHAVKLLEDFDIYGGFHDYALHWMISDEKETYVVEIIGNRLVAKKQKYMTNFYMNFGPVKEEQLLHGRRAFNLPEFTNYGSGLERAELILKDYDKADSFEGMYELMKSLRYSRSYDRKTEPFWFTEFTSPEKNLTVYSSEEDFAGTTERAVRLFETRDRKNPKGDWNTWHTSIYNIAKRELTIYSQEDYDRPYVFGLHGMTGEEQ